MDWEEEEKREQRRREIQAKIQNLRVKVNLMNEKKLKFEQYVRKINYKKDDWNDRYVHYTTVDLTPDIKMNGFFEGMVAERFAEELPCMVQHIRLTELQMDDIKEKAAGQIDKVDSYIEQLNKEISELESELASI